MSIRNKLLFVLCAGVLDEGAAIAQSKRNQPDPVVETARYSREVG